MVMSGGSIETTAFHKNRRSLPTSVAKQGEEERKREWFRSKGEGLYLTIILYTQGEILQPLVYMTSWCDDDWNETVCVMFSLHRYVRP